MDRSMKMKHNNFTGLTMRHVLLLMAMLSAFAGEIRSQVTIDAKIDSAQILIGEQTAIRIETCYDADSKAYMPRLKDTITKGVEIVETLRPDTQMLNEGRRYQITNTYIVTSFDSAFYYIPPFVITVDGVEYKSEALPLKVLSVPVDTLHADSFFGYKDIMEPDFVLADWIIFFVYSIVLVLVAALLVYVIMRYRDNKPILKKIHIEPKVPADELALAHMEELRKNKERYADNPKAYYTELTDAVRSYIAERFEFDAMEMTSSQIIKKLLESNERDALKKLNDVLDTADLVKFAKYNPMENENDMNLISAVAFINNTRVEIPEDKKEKPKDIVIEEPRSKKAKEKLLYGIIGISTVLCIVVSLLAYEIYKLFV